MTLDEAKTVKPGDKILVAIDGPYHPEIVEAYFIGLVNDGPTVDLKYRPERKESFWANCRAMRKLNK